MGGKRAEPRVAFVSLIDAGLIAPGTSLYDARAAGRRDPCAPTARSPSAARPARSTASAPMVQGLDACNGWTFWHMEMSVRTQFDVLGFKDIAHFLCDSQIAFGPSSTSLLDSVLESVFSSNLVRLLRIRIEP
jgi:hypothetical protein